MVIFETMSQIYPSQLCPIFLRHESNTTPLTPVAPEAMQWSLLLASTDKVTGT